MTVTMLDLIALAVATAGVAAIVAFFVLWLAAKLEPMDDWPVDPVLPPEKRSEPLYLSWWPGKHDHD